VLDLLKVQELEDYLHNVRGNAQTASGIVYNQPEQAIIAPYQRLQENATALSQERARLVAQRQIGSLTPAEEQRLTELSTLLNELTRQFNEFIASPDIQDLLAKLRANPEVYEQTLQLSSLTRFKEELAEVNGVLLYPLVLDKRLELIITAPNAEPIRRTVEGVDREELNRVITEFRQALDSPTGDIMPSAQKLYSWLIEPIEADLAAAGVDTIIYAPDGPLRYIPLAALHDGNQWLIQRFAINNITAVSLQRRATPTVADLSILAGAFANSATVYSPEAARGDQYYGLPFAGEEVKTLQALLPNTTALYDQDFSLTSVEKGMGSSRFNVLHFATHATLVSDDVNQSFILFGTGETMTLAAIKGWSFNGIDLVVLSACETGLGGFDNNGGQILGLGYQFHNRGVGAVVASLWQVNDGGTQVLMNAFYSALNQGMGKAEALQAAQQAMITGNLAAVGGDRGASIEVVSTTTGQPLTPGGTLAHPYYWAPFILIGL
jgi:CHAT domain-containing protein